MKLTFKSIMLLVSIVLFLSLFLKYDMNGFYYGFDCTFCNEKLPYNLKPHDGDGFSFTLKNEDDFELVGIGFRYRKTNFKINEFLGYAYNDTSIVIMCTDSLNEIKYLISYKTKYISDKGNPEISFKELSTFKLENNLKSYRWVKLNNDIASKIRVYKSLSFIGLILSVILFFTIIMRYKKTLSLRYGFSKR